MPRLSTVADRAATARRRAGRRASSVVRDPCPLCGVDLGGMHHTTRRKVVFTSVPGSFKWRCPDCSGVWEQATVDRAADQATAAAVPEPAAAGDLTVERDLAVEQQLTVQHDVTVEHAPAG